MYRRHTISSTENEGCAAGRVRKGSFSLFPPDSVDEISIRLFLTFVLLSHKGGGCCPAHPEVQQRLVGPGGGGRGGGGLRDKTGWFEERRDAPGRRGGGRESACLPAPHRVWVLWPDRRQVIRSGTGTGAQIYLLPICCVYYRFVTSHLSICHFNMQAAASSSSSSSSSYA